MLFMKSMFILALFSVAPAVHAAAISCHNEIARIEISADHKAAKMEYDGLTRDMVCGMSPKFIFQCQSLGAGINVRSFLFVLQSGLPGSDFKGFLKEDTFRGYWTIGAVPCEAVSSN